MATAFDLSKFDDDFDVDVDELNDSSMNFDDTGSNDGGEYDDNALSDLINKLRAEGAAVTSKKVEDEAPVEMDLDLPEASAVDGAPFSPQLLSMPDDLASSDDDLDDDAIAKHLQMLAGGFKKGGGKKLDTTKRMSGSDSYDGGQHTDDDSSDDDDDDDDSSDEEESDEEDNTEKFKEVDQFMKQLGMPGEYMEKTDENVVEERKRWLEQMSKQGASDYAGAPTTVGAKKQWLARLAKDLIQGASDSDDDSQVELIETEDMMYQMNMQDLVKASEQAQELIQEVDEEEILKLTAPPRLDINLKKKSEFEGRDWKNQPKRSFGEDADDAAMVEDDDDDDNDPFDDDILNFDDEDDEFEPIILNTGPVSSLVSALETKPEEKESMKDMPSVEEVDETAAAKPVPTDEPAKVEAKEEHEKESQLVSPDSPGVEKQPVEEEKKDGEAQQTAAGAGAATEPKKIVIPEGMPPYPGYGPKWPWHPDSPNAPPGYRECYFQYMGEQYHQYMQYLQSLHVEQNEKIVSEVPKPLEKPKPERKAVIVKGDQHQKFASGKGKIAVVSAKDMKKMKSSSNRKSTSGKKKSTKNGPSSRASTQSSAKQSTKVSAKAPAPPAADQGCACVIL